MTTQRVEQETGAGEDEGLDSLDELMLESTRTVTAGDIEDLLDLDQLLAESVEITAAKRAARTGRKLTADQQILLETNAIAEKALEWDDLEAVAHFVAQTCACGSHTTAFDAWFILAKHRRQSHMRLTRSADHNGLPSSTFTTEKVVDYCHSCLEACGLPATHSGAIPLLTSLGVEAGDCDCGQTAFELTSKSLGEHTLTDDDLDNLLTEETL